MKTAGYTVNGVDEVLLIAKSAGCVFHPLDFGVKGLAGRIRHSMLKEHPRIFAMRSSYESSIRAVLNEMEHRIMPYMTYLSTTTGFIRLAQFQTVITDVC